MNDQVFKDGFKESLKGIDADGNNGYKKIFEWFGYGGVREDDPQPIVSSLINLYFNNARSNQHFHNPLMPWDEAGLHDILSILEDIPDIGARVARFDVLAAVVQVV
jgi:hypothetical protein